MFMPVKLPSGLTIVLRETFSCLKLPPGEKFLGRTHSEGNCGRDPKAA